MKIYSKFIGAVIATVISAIVAAQTDGHITTSEWINVAIIGVGACHVFVAPNIPGAKYTKTVIAVLTAVLTAVASYISNGITTAEWLQVGIAALTAVGVYALPKSGAYPD